MATIAKFMCTERHERTHTTPYQTPDSVPEPGPSEVQVKLEAAQRVSEGPDGDNVDWSKYTPVGELTMTITNPAAFGQFVVGQDYFLEIRKAQPQKSRRWDCDDAYHEPDPETKVCVHCGEKIEVGGAV